MYNILDEDWDYWNEKEFYNLNDYDNLVRAIKMLGVFFLLADYSKFALGYI